MVLLATEGERTEVIYFNALKLKHRNVVTVVISGGKPGESNPKRVLKRLREEVTKHKRRNDWLGSDSAWLVVDTDSWSASEQQEIVAALSKKDFCLAASNPCFELWLLLHFRDAWTAATSKDLKQLLCLPEFLGEYSKSDYPADVLLAKIAAAIQRAKKADISAPDQWPAPGSTRVYKVVEAICQRGSL